MKIPLRSLNCTLSHYFTTQVTNLEIYFFHKFAPLLLPLLYPFFSYPSARFLRFPFTGKNADNSRTNYSNKHISLAHIKK